jgi:hypothetical protein
METLMDTLPPELDFLPPGRGILAKHMGGGNVALPQTDGVRVPKGP